MSKVVLYMPADVGHPDGRPQLVAVQYTSAPAE
jgi:hypothetical protein